MSVEPSAAPATVTTASPHQAGVGGAEQAPWWSAKRRVAAWGLLLIAPMVIGYVIFFIIPLIASFFLSFTEWTLLSSPVWVGLNNYGRLLQDVKFQEALLNTVALTVPNVILRVTIALFIAIALNTKLRFRNFYRTLFFIPVLTMPVATATVWQWLYDPTYGPINAGLEVFGINGPSWLMQPQWTTLALLIVLLWGGVGYDMIIYLAGLQGIPRDYYEASQLDGAGFWRQFRDITVPLLTPTIFFLLIIAIINSFQVFDLVYIMTRIDTSGTTFPTLVYYIYEEGFRNFRMGYAVTLSWALLVILIVFTVVQFRLQRRWVHYE
jgi:multiple sugar transport system permease protein